MARLESNHPAKRLASGDEEQGEHLLPGIPDEITLNLIVTQLPWQSLHILPSLSRRWREAIQSRQVYDARVHHHMTETLVVLHHQAGPKCFFVLYSVRERLCYFLPPIPDIQLGIPRRSQFIAFEGKIYVLGGLQNSFLGIDLSEKVYVLDLVGQRQWKQCASIPGPKWHFRCGVVDGKIYLFGDSCELDSRRSGSSQVYDPKEDAWSPITPMAGVNRNSKVATLGEELFVYKGDPSIKFGRMYIYHPLKNEWRNFGRKGISGIIFVWNGKFHALTSQNVPLVRMSTSCELTIDVFNMDSKLWTQVHSSTYTELGSSPFLLRPCAVLKVDYELLALVHLIRIPYSTSRMHVLQSKGFGAENKEITWEKISLSFDLRHSMCTVEL